MDTVMSTESGLYQLMTWLSPSFPVGAYTFSHGLESAIDSGLVSDRDDVRSWISELVAGGDGQADLVFVAAAWAAHDDQDDLEKVHELALAFQPTAEIRLETVAQGSAFLKTTAAAWPCKAAALLEELNDGTVAYPVAVGAIAASHDVDRRSVVEAYCHAFVANLVSAAVRLIPLGQTDGQAVIASLQGDVHTAVDNALATPLEAVTSTCPVADIMSMQHEVQYTRLFRS